MNGQILVHLTKIDTKNIQWKISHFLHNVIMAKEFCDILFVILQQVYKIILYYDLPYVVFVCVCVCSCGVEHGVELTVGEGVGLLANLSKI